MLLYAMDRQIKTKLLFFTWFIASPVLLLAQKKEDPFPFTHIEYYGPGQGLNGAGVCYVTQDSLGFLWFITDVALNRFDGYSFRSWSYNARDPNSLRVDAYEGLTEDRNGVLWIAATVPQGLYSFNPKQENFFNYRYQRGK